MGGIQSKNALPDDAVFKEKNNPYDVAAYKRICAEFGIDPSTDFRYTRGKNGGLGTVYIWASGSTATDYHYPDRILLCSMMSGKQIEQSPITKPTVSISYEMIRAQTNSSSILCQTVPVALHQMGSVE